LQWRAPGKTATGIQVFLLLFLQKKKIPVLLWKKEPKNFCVLVMAGGGETSDDHG
jgi:hypothetical protein